jgi:putative spermidine/putrescine transport system permease protein
MTIAMTDHTARTNVDGAALARRLRGLRRKGQVKALLLVAPLMLFLLAIFVLPIGMLLTRSVDNSDVSRTLPATVSAFGGLGRAKRARRSRVRGLRRRSQGGVA